MRSWVEISRHNLRHNLQLIRKLVGPKVLIAPCIKANAYGHGLLEIARELDRPDSQVDWLCVQSVEEAKILRSNNASRIQKPILLISAFLEDEICDLIDLGIKTFVFDKPLIKRLDQEAGRQGKVIDVHLLVNTGMGWLGILPKETVEYAELISSCSNLNFEGLTTHFSTSDDFDSGYFENQLNLFKSISSSLESKGLHPAIRHCANSGAFLRSDQAYFDLIQPGISLFGMYPSHDSQQDFENRTAQSLKPVLSFKTRIAALKNIPAGHGIGYANTYITTQDTLVATLPCGYWDGLDRRMSNNGYVELGGVLYPIIGRIGMNSTMVDISGLNFEAKVGQEVTLVSSDPNSQISATRVAERIGTINYEISTRINPQLERKVV